MRKLTDRQEKVYTAMVNGACLKTYQHLKPLVYVPYMIWETSDVCRFMREYELTSRNKRMASSRAILEQLVQKGLVRKFKEESLNKYQAYTPIELVTVARLTSN